jgi:hypothetical protein
VLRTTTLLCTLLAPLLLVTGCGDDESGESSSEPTRNPRIESFLTELTALDGVAGGDVEVEDVEGEGIHSLDVFVELGEDATEAQGAEVLEFVFDEAPAIDPGRDLYVHANVAETGLYVVYPGQDDPALLADALLTGHRLSALGDVELTATPINIAIRLPEGSDGDDVAAAAGTVLEEGVSPGVGSSIIAADGSYLSAVDGADGALVERWTDLVDTLGAADGFEVVSVDLKRDPTVKGPGRVAATVEIRLPGLLTPSKTVPDRFQELIWPMVTDQLDLIAGWERGATLQVVNNYTDEPGANSGRDGLIYAITGPGVDDDDKRGWSALAEAYLAERG